MAAILLPAQNPGLRATAARARPAGASPPHLCSQCSASWSMLAGQYGWRLEHAFRFVKHTLGWMTVRPRSPQAADRWTWLIAAGLWQLWLARWLTVDAHLPWERRTSQPPTPGQVQRGFAGLLL